MNSAFKSQSLAILCVAVSAFNLCSCGNKKSDDSANVVRPFLSTRPPAHYAIYDSACQEKREPVTIADSIIAGWKSGFQITSELTPFENTVTNVSLESQFVSSTGYGKLFTRTCADKSCVNTDGTIVDYQKEPGFKPLRVCESGTEFPTDTYESVALTTLHSINKGGRAYEAYTGRTLPRVHLEVIPSFETTQPAGKGEQYDTKYYATDNLAYFPLQNAIMVFAQSQEAVDNNRDQLWKSAFVDLHELGHRIQDAHKGSSLRKYGFTWDMAQHAYVNDDSLNGNHQAKMWTTLSEANADNLAFYADDESPYSIEQLDCIGRNRNASIAYFADNLTPKIFDLSAYNELLTGSRNNKDCHAVEFSDAHIAGAVFAHLNHETFNVATSHLPETKRIARKYNYALEWYDQLNVAHDHNPGEQNIFKHHKEASEVIFAGASRRQKAKICALNAQLIPFLTPPFEGYCEKRRFAFTQPWNSR